MNITFSIDDEVFDKVRREAEAMGTSVSQLVREYLETLAGEPERIADAEEFVRLSYLSQGNSHGWQMNRDEAHERK
ncbi:MAG: DUF6364 family protein [Bryobacteraceae bacterium]